MSYEGLMNAGECQALTSEGFPNFPLIGGCRWFLHTMVLVHSLAPGASVGERFVTRAALNPKDP